MMTVFVGGGYNVAMPLFGVDWKRFLGKAKTASVRAIQAVDREFNAVPSEWVRCEGGAGVLVFVHGLLSEGDRAWESKSADWMDICVADEELKGWDILRGEWYTTALSGKHDLGDAAAKLYGEMTSEIGGQGLVVDAKKIVFVCHSMGGLVVRKLLVDHPELLEGRRIGVLTLSTPAKGLRMAELAGRLPVLAENALLRELQPSHDETLELDRAFGELVRGNEGSLWGVEAFEECLVGPRVPLLAKGYRWFGSPKGLVTREMQGGYFGSPVLVEGTDHRSISRPGGLEAEVHGLLRGLCGEVGGVE